MRENYQKVLHCHLPGISMFLLLFFAFCVFLRDSTAKKARFDALVCWVWWTKFHITFYVFTSRKSSVNEGKHGLTGSIRNIVCVYVSMSTSWNAQQIPTLLSNIKMTIKQNLKYNLCSEKQNKEVFINKLNIFFPGGEIVELLCLIYISV